mmetsp:Transcript_7197/g.19465  ORF Transcript_7197/g.19465 Transcript_7197/m.19465 type:complete len:313 (+) Transcript_7197:30-968(+)
MPVHRGLATHRVLSAYVFSCTAQGTHDPPWRHSLLQLCTRHLGPKVVSARPLPPDVDCIPAVGEGSLTALVGVVQAGRRVGACHTQLRNCSTCCNTFCPMLNRRVRQITVPARPLPPCINVVNIVQAASRAGVCDIGLHRNLDGLLREDLLGHLSDVPDPSLRRHRLLRTLLGPDVALRAPLVIAQLLDAVGKAALRAASTLALLVPDAQGLLVELSDANLLLAMRKPAAFLITLALLVGLAELRLVKVRRVLQLCARVCEEALVAKVALALQVLRTDSGLVQARSEATTCSARRLVVGRCSVTFEDFEALR